MSKDGSNEVLSRVLSLMPHKPPMLFLDRVVSVDDPTIICEVQLLEDHLMARDGQLTNLLAVELFAQSAAALMVHRSTRSGRPIMGAGALLGTKEIRFHTDRFRVGEVLTVEVTENWGSGALAQMGGRLFREGDLVAEGSITVAAGAPQ